MHVRGVNLLNVDTPALGQHRDCRIEPYASHGRPYERLVYRRRQVARHLVPATEPKPMHQ